MADVPRPKALRQQHLDGLADDFVVPVPEQGRDLAIGETDETRGIDDDHRIGRGIERAAGEIRRSGMHGSGPHGRLFSGASFYNIAGAVIFMQRPLFHAFD